MRRGDASRYKGYPELAKKQPVFTAINTPKAVRKWRCEVCGEIIPIGSRYLRYIRRIPFQIDDCAYHFQCFALIQAYCKATGKRRFMNGWVRVWAKHTFCKCKECQYHLHDCPKIAKKIKFKRPKFPFEKEETT